MYTTGTDGLRLSRTDNLTLTDKRIVALHEHPADLPCAHQNGYYHAALLLAYQIDGNPVYLETARKGLPSLMHAYSNTIREHS